MRNKITVVFLGVIALATVFIFVLSILGMYLLLHSSDDVSDYPPNLTLEFDKYFDFEKSLLTVTEQGLDILIEKNAWIQILNANGEQVYQFHKPNDALEHYTPAQIVYYHMYPNAIQGYTLFVASVNESSSFSYIIGFPSSDISKFTFDYNSSAEVLFRRIGLVMVTIFIIVYAVMGLLFSNRLASPLLSIIEGVETLSKKQYLQLYKEEGIYNTVFRSLNNLTETLKKSEQERNQTEKIRAEWIVNISHDLKTPLSSIKGYSEFLANENYTISREEILQCSQIILKNANYMDELIEDLRLNEALKNYELPIKKINNNLTQFLRAIIIDILNHPEYKDRTIDFNPQEEEINYSFDPHLFRRSITNLLHNALVHNDTNTKVSIRLYTDNGIHIEIEDTGKGITEEALEQLFNRYYRGTNTNNYAGSGLGLSIAKEVIEAHGGNIYVESIIEKGTVIQILL